MHDRLKALLKTPVAQIFIRLLCVFFGVCIWLALGGIGLCIEYYGYNDFCTSTISIKECYLGHWVFFNTLGVFVAVILLFLGGLVLALGGCVVGATLLWVFEPAAKGKESNAVTQV